MRHLPAIFLLSSFLLPIFWPQSVSAQIGKSDPWVVYYDDEAPVEAFRGFELIVLDSDFHPSLAPLKAQGSILLGYISLGEVEAQRAHFSALREEGLLLEENVNWPGSFMIDVRDARWRRRVVEELAPAILAKGFDGLFLDTLDNPAYLEAKNPQAFGGMTSAAVELVLAIRAANPGMPIMLNRAYELIPRVGGAVDMLLGEAVFATHDFASGEYGRVRGDLYRQQVEILQQAKAANPKLRVMTLDYWDPEDRDGIARIYQVQRANGFIPYVATIELDRIVREPGK